MNKMAKGAIATAAGVVLLIGGGGTLAQWNVDRNSEAGTIASGNMTLSATDGKWTTASGQVIEAKALANFKIVPGDVLTYSQEITADLVGQNLKAKLAVTGTGANGTGELAFAAGTFDVGQVELSNIRGEVDEDGTLLPGRTEALASAKFTFHGDSRTSGEASMNSEYKFTDVAFELDQVIPTPAQ